MYRSETSKFRELLAPHCQGTGLDLGFGGDPIRPDAICLDLPEPYAETGHAPRHLAGDARDLRWFRDGVLDYVYSSHLLEDFVDKEAVLREWTRVLRPGGALVLLLPDEQRFRSFCDRSGTPRNEHHANPGFSLETLLGLLRALGLEVVGTYEPLVCDQEGSDYNFAVVARKPEP